MDNNVIANLIDTIINDNRAATWSDSEIIEKLIKCGLEEKDFIHYGFEDFVEDYFCIDDEDDDNDFLQDLIDDAETEEMIGYWLEELVSSFGKNSVDELTAEEISIEIDDIKGTISNESIVLGISEFAEQNIKQYEAYLKVLEEMLKNKEEN